MLNPFQVDQTASMILRCESSDVEVLVRYVIAVSSEAVTSRAQRLGLNGGVIVHCAAGREECANAVAEPECGEDVGHLLCIPIRDITLGIHHGDVGRKAVLAP